MIGHARASRLTLVLLLLLATGCTSWTYSPLGLPEGLHDVRTKSRDDITVSVAIRSDEEARSHFGLDLGEADVQAIWLRVRNASQHTLWFLRAVLDADFYPADEAAVVARGKLNDEDFERARQRLRDESIDLKIPGGTRVQGFVFAPKALGGRYVDVRLVQDVYEAELARQHARKTGTEAEAVDDLEFRFGFALPLPDGLFDYERLDPDKTYAGRSLPDLDRKELRDRIEALPCCSTNADGDVHGDPLNLVIIGDSTDVLNSLSRAGWSFTHSITPRSVAHLVGAALNNKAYPVAPVSDLHAFGRKQDFALQRARTSIAQRNHMRLWLAPFTYRGQQVWVGQISRDIGIKLTPKAPSLTTHVIDPEVDQAREYLLQTLLAGGFVRAFGFASGSRAATRDEPALNLVNDPFFSDGMRLVVLLSPDPVPYPKVRSLLWRESAAPVDEGLSREATRNEGTLNQDLP